MILKNLVYFLFIQALFCQQRVESDILVTNYVLQISYIQQFDDVVACFTRIQNYLLNLELLFSDALTNNLNPSQKERFNNGRFLGDVFHNLYICKQYYYIMSTQQWIPPHLVNQNEIINMIPDEQSLLNIQHIEHISKFNFQINALKDDLMVLEENLDKLEYMIFRKQHHYNFKQQNTQIIDTLYF